MPNPTLSKVPLPKSNIEGDEMAKKLVAAIEELEHRTPLADNPIIAGDNIAEVFEQIDHEVEMIKEALAEVAEKQGG
jgi:hypothetical protein